MTRRLLFRLITGILLPELKAFSSKSEMPWFDYRREGRGRCWPADLIARTHGGYVLLDRQKIDLAFYAHMGRGEVGTYDVRGDRQVHWDRKRQGPAFKILRGRVEIFGPDGKPA